MVNGHSFTLIRQMAALVRRALAEVCTVPLLLFIIRQHRSATYVDAVYCYRSSTVVCRSVTQVSPAKKAEPIKVPFGTRTRVGPGNHVLDGGSDPPMGKGNFEGGRCIPL